MGVNRSNPLTYDVTASEPDAEYMVNNVNAVTTGNIAKNAATSPLFSLPKYVAKVTISPPKIK